MTDKKLFYADLLKPRRLQIWSDVLIWTPYLFFAWLFVWFEFWPLAILCWFFFFLTGLRQAHEAFHRTMGIPRAANEVLLLFLSPLMLSCLHATRFIHLRHHRFLLRSDDIEGRAAQQSWIQALLLGPRYPWQSHREAWQKGNTTTRNWMKAEALCIVTFYLLGSVLQPRIVIPHLMAMVCAQWVVSFFAVWMVHHDCPEHSNPSRTIRSGWKRILTFHMFYHHEHHAYPAVPTRSLPELARRMDARGISTGRQAF